MILLGSAGRADGGLGRGTYTRTLKVEKESLASHLALGRKSFLAHHNGQV